ncbi:hypothetical protein SAMN04488066_10897 [Halorubrum aquaticum]|uniref:Uncharacterized protein n=1 Tax=Halorubrum aquaticum TaxID=387340 RepID=A0A1I3AZZ1_9EURY|nr:hypothetical protein [Halorubrum aquaticum]SFH55637.1 hypothetical protein SAMN04488066_10897 [Halorubrum aquaticum]
MSGERSSESVDAEGTRTDCRDHRDRRGRRGRRGRRDRRGQTQIDFAVGAGVFLLALAFVVGFVPTLFEPFAVAETASPLVSDRIAAGTVDLLGASPNPSGGAAVHAPTEPGVLSPACTVAFFAANGTLADDAECPFDADTDPAELFGVDDDVEVVIHELDERSPAENPAVVDVETRHGTIEDVPLNRTSTDPSATVDDVTVSGRVVSLRGVQYRLTVRVW